MLQILKRIFATLLLALAASVVIAQRVRTLNYHPEGNSFVCVNGSNRYTRALYGGHTAWRLETSDRPVFATYSGSKDNRNVSFYVTVDNVTIPLDSTDYCEARYEAGRRDYVLRDKRWGKGELHLSVLAYMDEEGAIFKFQTSGFHAQPAIRGEICKNRLEKFVRAGDLGKFEPKDKFEASVGKEKLQTCILQMTSETGYITLENQTLSTRDDLSHTVAIDSTISEKFAKTEAARRALVSIVTFSTPDTYLNPIGGALVAAADGAWDGKVWNHGAVGWRSQLPGWRGAYMGDFLGMPDRQRTHFTAYAKSQVEGVPVTRPHLMDETNNLARGTYEWGTPMYSDGYICRRPEKNHEFHHYDMNLVYIDQLLWHFQFDADTAYMREMWHTITQHLKWERQAWDPDGDHLYDAYCCIWASDALGYNSGAVTHSSAYNYRANLLAARIAEIIGEDPMVYLDEADAILRAMNRRLWMENEGHWAEYQDFMGLRRQHPSAAVWSIYTPVDCGACTPQQAYSATQYIDRNIPHIPVLGNEYTISTSDWSPYEWSINNVAMAEVLHTALAYYKAGRADEAYRLLRGTVIDYMYAGQSPGNFGQTSSLDVATGEAYRDFADVVGIASRTFIEGLYGITPQALDGLCIIRSGFPSHWDHASVRTPYLSYSFERRDGMDHYHIKQSFKRPLRIVIRQNLGEGRYLDTELTDAAEQDISLPAVVIREDRVEYVSPDSRKVNTSARVEDAQGGKYRSVDMYEQFNANVTDIFRNRYLTPRSPYTTLCIPVQGVGDWCSTKREVDINDSVFRSLVANDTFTAAGIPFRTPQKGHNIAYVSLWDNYPDSVTLPLTGKASHACLLMAGSTNPMQSRIANGDVRVEYADGTCDTLLLTNPDNWCPIEQDYHHSSPAFPMLEPRPYRVAFATGEVGRTLSPGNYIAGGAAQILCMPLNPRKRLHSLTVRALSNEVVVGLMGVTLTR